MSIRVRQSGSYQVRVYPFPSKTFPKGAKRVAEAYELVLKLRRVELRAHSSNDLHLDRLAQLAHANRALDELLRARSVRA